MSDLEFRVDVRNGHVISEVEAHVERGVRSSLNTLGNGMREQAIQRLQNAGAIWSGELISSFDVDIYTRGNWMVVTLKNDAEHAEPIEFGAQYGDEGPPVAALIPWVATKMHWWDPTEMAERYDPVDVDEVREEAKLEATSERGDAFAMGASEQTIRKAFYLQQHIKETGIDAVRYMKEAQDWVENYGSDIVAAKITEDLNLL